ncbi:MAG: MlaD family protein [Muribaculaceae bacterium]|nr:MlaD family protein [Muribaculaceae bacterium]
MKKIFNKEFKIGLFVIIAIVILVVGIDYLKGINVFNPANFYYASYDNVQGLEVAAPVNMNGFKVGQVRSIEFDYAHPGKVKVQIAVNRDLHLPDDTQALIESTLLSGSFVNLKMGNSKKMLEVGSEVTSGVSPDMMAAVNNQIMPAVGEILPKVDQLLANLNKLVGDPALMASIQRLEGITTDISGLTGNLNVMSGQLKTTMSRDVPGVMRNVNSITHGLDTVTANLGVLSAQLKTLPLNATMDNVNELTANLTKFSQQLNDRNSTLGMLMNDPELYNRLNNVAADVDSLIVDIKKNPKRYISIKLL